jgi:hypothetical protein
MSALGRARQQRAAKRAPTSTTARTPTSTTARTPTPTTAQPPTPTTARPPTPTGARTPAPTPAPTIAAGNGAAAALERITKLRDQGALSYEEFAAAKARILSASRAARQADDERRRFDSVEASVAAAGDLADMSRTPSG